MDSEEVLKRCKENRRNINYMNTNSDPLDWMKIDLRENKKNLTRIIDSIEIPPPPPYSVCKYPLDVVKKMNGWSFAYEGLNKREFPEERFMDDLWDEVADMLAKNQVNFVRFFAFTAENPVMISQSIPPFIKEGGKWNCLNMDDNYIELVKRRLDSFTKRKITCEICCGSGIKGVANRWDHSYFNGKNNSNGTTEDVGRFYDDGRTKEIYGSYLEKMVLMFKNQYVKFSLMNEASGSVGRIYTWSWEMIRTYMRSHIPNDQIMIGKIDSSKIKDFLEEGIWVSPHAVNSEKTVKKFLTSSDRNWMVEYPTFFLCGDGGDEFGEDLGWRGRYWNEKFGKAAARQERNMIRIFLRGGGCGIDFMTALPYLDGVIPNLQRILDHGENGFSESELKKLSAELNRPQLLIKDQDGNYLNEWGELRECRAGFVNNLPE